MGFYRCYRWPTVPLTHSNLLSRLFPAFYPVSVLKRARRTRNLFSDIATKWVEQRCCACYHPRIKPVPERTRNERGSRRLGKVVAEGRDYVHFLQQTLHVHVARFTGSRQTCFAACMAWLPRNFSQPKVSIHTNLLARQIWTCKTRNIALLLEAHIDLIVLQCNW